MKFIACRLLPVLLILGMGNCLAAPVKPTTGNAAAQQRTMTDRKPAFAYRDQVLTEDVSWRGEVLVEGTVTIAPQATLTLEPGTVVRFRRTAGNENGSAALLVQGRIHARGSNDKPVLFTSAFDGVMAGDWDGIVLLASEKKNLMEHCRVEGAVTGFEGMFASLTMKHVQFAACRTGVKFRDSSAVIAGGGANGCGVGLFLRESEVDIMDANFSRNRQAVIATGTSLYLAGTTFSSNEGVALTADSCRLRISGCSFTANGSGLRLNSCEGSVSASRIDKNTDDGLSLVKSRLKVNGNELSQNGKVGLRVADGGSVAWGNTFSANGDYDLYNAGDEDFIAIGNWWGGVPASTLGRRIYGRHQDANRGAVRYIPSLPVRSTSGL